MNFMILQSIKNYFFFLDPLRKSFYITINIFFLTLISIFLWLYWQKPSGMFFLLTPIMTQTSAAFFYGFKDKIKAILFGSTALSCFVMIFYVLNDAGLLLLISVFLTCMIALSFSMIDASYRFVVLVVIACSSYASMQPPSWFLGVNAVINIYIISAISIFLQWIFFSTRHNYARLFIIGWITMSIKRLELISKAIKKNKEIDSRDIETISKNEFSLRIQSLVIHDAEKKIYQNNSVFSKVLLPDFRHTLFQLRFTIIALLYIEQVSKINTDVDYKIIEIIEYFENALKDICFALKSKKTLTVLKPNSSLVSLHQTWQEKINELPLNYQKLDYHLSNLQNDITQLNKQVLSFKGVRDA